MKTLKTTLIVLLLLVLTTSCTDLTEDLVTNPNVVNTELSNGDIDTGFTDGDTDNDNNNDPDNQDTGGTGSNSGDTGKDG
ncbi:hypothetical protein WH52_05285 [Tenacibaculum holothuriorum]|uniref:Uncharacterized protein n=1 Tax=Tenacibaculum holothuriorum TaxID=1635173 RepID=A0A1Y2PEQ4_9FLAO|nr:hypothetical protein [Tenacibaculum holothuriorum]OSY88199.1 hypothetical protein WH52_05285 [Tenacibaculum holothuriorum]